MADPICRWRNPYVNTIVELVKALPHQEMSSDDFRTIIEERWPGFLHTPYQLACQVGLYYESEDGAYHPRFNHDIDENEALSYMKRWIARYYVPNPYTKSMKTLKQPRPFLASIIRYVYEHPNETELHSILEAVFQEKIGNIDIISNVLNTYTNLIKVDALGNVELTVKAIDFMKQYMDRNDKKAFFENFSESNNAYDNISKNLIFYGAPGTGKSHTINEITETQPNENVFRTTFHPDSDYSTFVGCYKPTKTKTRRQQRMNMSLEDLAKELGSYYSNEELGKISGIQKFCYEYYPYIDGEYMSVNVTKLLELAGIPKDYNVEINKYVKFCHLFPKQDPDKITYEFVPQTFTKAYLRAWQTEEPVYLVIEEINRGNCAQIFGDLFQLLDRKNGLSEYPIKADNDLAAYIGEQLSKESREGIPETVKSGEELILPPNLFIWATMNTSDQSLFPIDSAFKRRWDWTYMPIIQGYDKETNQLLEWNIKVNNKDYNWWQFLQAINRHIGDITHSEDKKLGFFFCKAENNTISAETFVSKVLFYIWNDVYKDYDHSPAFFRDDNGKLIEFHEYYRQDENHKTVPDETKIQTFIEKVEPAFKTVDPDANPN